MAANRQSVPKFGEWTEDVPFTLVFDKASRSSKKNTNKSNPNPNEYPEMNPTPAQTRNQRHDQHSNHNVRPRQERLHRREETEYRPSPPADSERNNRVRAPPAAETYNHQSYGGGGRNPPETNRRQPYDPTPVKPSRPISNLRGRGSERGATIPPFPGSGSEDQSYTLIFEKVKENKRQSEIVRSYNEPDHITPTRLINDDQHHQPLPSSPKGCCFPRWGRKRSY
ncbi:hypothetical protein N665_0157s0201 [Sinapis alba]|nr:hypothetical protein N665_0157s0201 [Sinapis alba]